MWYDVNDVLISVWLLSEEANELKTIYKYIEQVDGRFSLT